MDGLRKKNEFTKKNKKIQVNYFINLKKMFSFV